MKTRDNQHRFVCRLFALSRTRRWRNGLAAVLTLCSVFALAVIPGTPVGAEPSRTTAPVIIGFDNFPDSFNPLNDNTTSAFATDTVVGDALVGVNPDTFRPIPALAMSWKTSNQGKTITLYLRRDVRFSDGRTMTASDVVYSANLQLVNGFLPSQAKGVSAVSPFTVRFTFSKPSPEFLTSWAYGYSPIFEKRAMEAHHIKPSDWANPNWGTDYKIVPVRAGAYRITDFVKGDHVTLTANPHYWQGRPSIQNIIIKTVASDPALITQLNSGSIQGIQLAPSDIPLVNRSQVHIYKAPGTHVYQIQLNLKRPYFADRRVRQALMYAIDRAGIARVVFHKAAQVANTDVTPADRFYDHHLLTYPYNPAEATKLLSAAGWTVGTGGIRSKNGQPFAFTLQYDNSNPDYSRIGIVVQQNLARVGIKVRLAPTDSSILGRLYDPKNSYRDSVDANLSQYASGPYPGLEYYYKCDTAFDWGGYCNKAMDKAIAAGTSATGGRKEYAAQNAQQAILNRDLPHLYLVTPDNLFAMDKQVRGFSPGFVNGLQSAWKWRWAR